MRAQLWIESVGPIIIARFRGIANQAFLDEAQQKIFAQVTVTGRNKVLYDALEMEPPSSEIPLWQQSGEKKVGPLPFRRAILVPDTRSACSARLAFGDGDYRIFYDDLAAAMAWLSPPTMGPRFSDRPFPTDPNPSH